VGSSGFGWNCRVKGWGCGWDRWLSLGLGCGLVLLPRKHASVGQPFRPARNRRVPSSWIVALTRPAWKIPPASQNVRLAIFSVSPGNISANALLSSFVLFEAESSVSGTAPAFSQSSTLPPTPPAALSSATKKIITRLSALSRMSVTMFYVPNGNPVRYWYDCTPWGDRFYYARAVYDWHGTGWPCNAHALLRARSGRWRARRPPGPLCWLGVSSL
jgi:hypothetical protein